MSSMHPKLGLHQPDKRGEGIFLKIAPTAICDWLARNEVRVRGEQLERGISRYRKRYDVEVERPGLPYVLLHSLALALMEQIALECRYPLSSRNVSTPLRLVLAGQMGLDKAYDDRGPASHFARSVNSAKAGNPTPERYPYNSTPSHRL